jgi:chemotaxis protein MotB
MSALRDVAMIPRRPFSRPKPAGHQRWLVSYADFITLLFAFFATMYAMSSVDARKMTRVAQGLHEAFDSSARLAMTAGEGVLPGHGSRIVSNHARELETIESLRERVAAALGGESKLALSTDPRGLVISIPEAGTFPTGSDELSREASVLISRVADGLASSNNGVRVEGHTDDQPIHTLLFRSNWDLSTARAVRVVELLTERGLAPERLAAAGFAEFHPRVPNDSPSARATNRRVDLVVLAEGAAR